MQAPMRRRPGGPCRSVRPGRVGERLAHLLRAEGAVRGLTGRALDQAMDARSAFAPVQGARMVGERDVGLGDALIVAHIVQPGRQVIAFDPQARIRSEEHTSELQSLMRISYAVFCLKKNK